MKITVKYFFRGGTYRQDKTPISMATSDFSSTSRQWRSVFYALTQKSVGAEKASFL
jgi:hypothetical protein